MAGSSAARWHASTAVSAVEDRLLHAVPLALLEIAEALRPRARARAGAASGGRPAAPASAAGPRAVSHCA